MGTKLPSDVASSDQQGDVYGTERALQEKYAWQADRDADFHPTASILRYTFTDPDPSIRSRGTATQTTGLSDLACTVDDFTTRFAEKYGAKADEGDKLFTFYDVQVVMDDRINYDGNVWEPVAVWYREESGRCEVQARIVAEE